MSGNGVRRRAAGAVAAVVAVAMAVGAGSAGAASSSPFACDQPAWAGGVAMTVSLPANAPAADVPVPRPCLDGPQVTVTASAGTVSTGTQGTVPPDAQFVRYTPAPGQPQGTATLTFTTADGQTESVAVNVGGGSDPAPDVVAIGDSVTAGFGYCGSGDSCDLDAKIAAWWTTLKGCQQEAEYPNAPIDLCSNSRANGGLPWTVQQGSGGSVAYPFQFASWLDSASGAAGQPQPSVRNWAVSGARPAHWDPVPIAGDPTNEQSTPGAFSPQTEQIRDSLVVMTLGANRLLSDFLAFQFTFSSLDMLGPQAACTGRQTGGWFSSGYDDAPNSALQGCFDLDWATNNQTAHLISTYRTLLSQGNRVLVVGYHLACPSSFGTWQNQWLWGPSSGTACTSETGSNGGTQFGQATYLLGLLNDQVAQAVQTTQEWARTTWPEQGRDAQIAFLDTASLDDWTDHQAWSDEPWVFPNDTGIHPSRRGHAVMAGNVADAACGLLGLYCAQHAATDPSGFSFPGSTGAAARADREPAAGAVEDGPARADGAQASGAGDNARIAPRAVPAATVLARVGGRPITARQVKQMAAALGERGVDPAGERGAEGLGTLIAGMQVRAEARRLGIAVPRGRRVARLVRVLGGRRRGPHADEHRWIAVSAVLADRVAARLAGPVRKPSAAAARAFARREWAGDTIRPEVRTVCLVLADTLQQAGAARAELEGGDDCAAVERRHGRAGAGRVPGERTVTRAHLARPVADLVFGTPVGSSAQAALGGADTAGVAVRVQRAEPARRVALTRAVVRAARRTLADERREARRDRADRAMDRRWDDRTRCTRAARGNPACSAALGLWIW